MTILSEARSLFEEWMTAVTQAVDFAVGRYTRRSHILLSGESGGVLPADWQAAFRGSRIETALASGQVLFRPLDFPKQAEDFLDGMIRTQIDRLTPWPADDALFGWSSPSTMGQERIELTLAATSKQELEPLIQLATGLGAQSLAAFALP